MDGKIFAGTFGETGGSDSGGQATVIVKEKFAAVMNISVEGCR